MSVFDELKARGMIAQMTNEEKDPGFDGESKNQVLYRLRSHGR